MKWMRVKAIAKKEFLQIRRDPFSLAMAILLPMILLFIFAYAISFDVDKIATVIYDADRSRLSRELIDCFTTSDYFRVAGYIDRSDSIDKWLDTRKAKAAITIPPDFSKKIRSGGKADISVIIDGSDSNTATIAQGYIAAIAETYTHRVVGQRAERVIDVRQRVWYNTELRSRNFIIPGLIAVIMAVIIALLTSLTVSREWDRGTMEQLISTPVKATELIVGKLIPYFVIGLTDTILCILMGTLAFGVPLRGSIWLLLALSALFLFGGLSFGIFISIISKNQLVASQIAMLSTFLPAFLLSGFVFSIGNMPIPLQVITYAVPARYFVTILKGIFLKGSAVQLLVMEILLLSLFALVVFLASARIFKKRVE